MSLVPFRTFALSPCVNDIVEGMGTRMHQIRHTLSRARRTPVLPGLAEAVLGFCGGPAAMAAVDDTGRASFP